MPARSYHVKSSDARFVTVFEAPRGLCLSALLHSEGALGLQCNSAWTITPEDLTVLSPYLTARIQRFGVYATDEVALTPEPFDARLGFDLAAAS